MAIVKLVVVSGESFGQFPNRHDYLRDILCDLVDSGKVKEEDEIVLQHIFGNTGSTTAFDIFDGLEFTSVKHMQSSQAIEVCDLVLALCDSKCEATISSIKFARQLSKPTHVYKYKV